MRIFYTIRMGSAFLSNMQSPEAKEEITDVFDWIKLKIFYMATNIMSKIKQINHRLGKYVHNKCQKSNFLSLYIHMSIVLNKIFKRSISP